MRATDSLVSARAVDLHQRCRAMHHGLQYFRARREVRCAGEPMVINSCPKAADRPGLGVGLRLPRTGAASAVGAACVTAYSAQRSRRSAELPTSDNQSRTELKVCPAKFQELNMNPIPDTVDLLT